MYRWHRSYPLGPALSKVKGTRVLERLREFAADHGMPGHTLLSTEVVTMQEAPSGDGCAHPLQSWAGDYCCAQTKVWPRLARSICTSAAHAAALPVFVRRSVLSDAGHERGAACSCATPVVAHTTWGRALN